jgi:hypothetical protein
MHAIGAPGAEDGSISAGRTKAEIAARGKRRIEKRIESESENE